MFRKLFLTVCFLLTTLGVSSTSFAQEESQVDPQEMMKKMQEHATPGKKHKLLEHLVGKWKTEMTVMGGPPTEGEAEFKWVLGNRYVQQSFSGSMMGTPYEGMGFYGYDNYKKKFTSTWVDSMSTTMNHAEGMLNQAGATINFFGTMDEYLTGEHDKPIKYVLNMSEKDVIHFEIHDLAIGDASMVIGIKYIRVEESGDDEKSNDKESGKKDGN